MSVKCHKTKQIGVGQGFNSEVWLADDPQLNGIVAVKEIPKARLDEQGITDYFGEAKTMFATRHPENVVPINFAGEDETGERICLVMPYFEKGSLLDRIKQCSLSNSELIRIGLGVLSGLQCIHNAGYLHYDLKPSNVLFCSQDRPMVADFGQTKAINRSTGTAELPWLYTFGVPPELVEGTELGTVISDVFQAGSTLYRAANGEPIYTSQKSVLDNELPTAIQSGRFPDSRFFLPHVTRATKKAIRKALNVNPADRYRSASDFACDLEKVQIKYNWTASHSEDGSINWTGSRAGHSTLDVRLILVGRKYRTEAFKRNGQSNRCFGKSSGIWKSGMTRTEAFKHLRPYFRELE